MTVCMTKREKENVDRYTEVCREYKAFTKRHSGVIKKYEVLKYTREVLHKAVFEKERGV